MLFWVAVVTSGKVGSIGIVFTWSLHKQSTGLLKEAMLLSCGVVPSSCSGYVSCVIFISAFKWCTQIHIFFCLYRGYIQYKIYTQNLKVEKQASSKKIEYSRLK